VETVQPVAPVGTSAEPERRSTRRARLREESRARAAAAGPTPAEQARIEELESALAFARRVESGEVSLHGPQYDPAQAAEYRQSGRDLQVKLRTLKNAIAARQSWAQSGRDMPAQVEQQLETIEAVTLGRAAPFVDLAAGTVDVAGALSVGVPDSDLRAVGVPQAAIDSTRGILAARRERRVAPGPAAAPVTPMRQLPPEDRARIAEATTVTEGQAIGDGTRLVAVGTSAPVALQDYEVRTPSPLVGGDEVVGYDLARYLADHPGDVATLQQAGFTAEQIAVAEAARPATIQERFDAASQVMFGRPWEELSVTQQAMVGKGAEDIRVYSPATMPTSMRLLTAATPITGTMYFWEQMSPGQRALSVGMDVLAIFGGWLIPKALRGVGGALKGSSVADDVARNVARYNRIVASGLREVDPGLARAMQNLTRAQTAYADDLLKVRALETTVQQADDLLRSGQLAPGSGRMRP
jgi:hypothetical protein